MFMPTVNVPLLKYNWCTTVPSSLLINMQLLVFNVKTATNATLAIKAFLNNVMSHDYDIINYLRWLLRGNTPLPAQALQALNTMVFNYRQTI